METNRYKEYLKKKKALDKEWWSGRSLFGNSWAMFFALIGGREAGKSYFVTNFFVGQWKKYGRPFYWMRLTDSSANKLLMNNAEKLIDPDIRRRFNLDIEVSGGNVYEIVDKKNVDGKVKKERKLMARVLALSTFYNDKGSGLFDKDFLNDPKMFYNICLDEMNREKNEKKTFDILYAFVNEVENLVRSTKDRIRIVMIGNTLEEASDLMCGFNFLPEQFGRFYLKSKRCVIEYIEPSEKYLARRKGTVADILMPQASTFTNQIKVDASRIYKGKLTRPQNIIKFDKDISKWYTLWEGGIICPYNKEKVPVWAMRPYIDEIFVTERRDVIFNLFDTRSLLFRNLITFKRFQKELEFIKPRK